MNLIELKIQVPKIAEAAITQNANEPALEVLHGKSIGSKFLVNASLKIKMETNVFLQKILWLCCRSWARRSVGHFNDSIIQGMQTYRLVRTATVLSMFCSTSVMSR